MVDYTQMIYGRECDSEDSGGSIRQSNLPVKESSGQSRASSGASRQERRAKSRSPRKASIAADSPTKSPSKVAISTRGSKSDCGVSFVEGKPVSPHHSLDTPRYSQSPAQRQRSTRERNGPPHTYTSAYSNPDEPRWPVTHKFSRSRSSPQTIQSPQTSLNTINAPDNRRPSTSPSSGLPMASGFYAIRSSLNRSPSVNPFRPVGEVAHHPNLPVPSIPVSIETPFARRSSERSSRHQSPPNPWTAHRTSDNPFASFPRTRIPDRPIVPGLMAPPPPLTGPPLEKPPIFPPPSEVSTPGPAPDRRTYTQPKGKSPTKKTSTQQIKNVIDKVSKTPKKSKEVGTLKKTSKSPTTTQYPPRALRPKQRIRYPRLPAAIDAPSRNTRARVMERKRQGQEPLVRGTRVGYEVLEEVEREARRVGKVRRERERVGRERREGVGRGD